MAEKLMDSEDRMLKSMFASEPIADDGFSEQIVKRIRRRIWVQRLALPVAILIGAGIAIKPASQLVVAVSKLLTAVPQDVVEAPVGWLPSVENVAISGSLVQTVVYGVALLAVGFLGSRMLSE